MDLFAAIDVGSNSVRMQVAAFVSGFQHHVVHEERAVTRLGQRVFRDGRISERATRDTLEALKTFRKRMEEYTIVAARAVGTSALREAANARKFLKLARRECGLEVDIISGREEARLIHLGVISRIPNPRDPLLLIDIGGGSAEFTLSRNGRIAAASSAPLGAVRLTEMFLESDPATPTEIERLEGHLRKKLGRVRKTLGEGSLRDLRVIGTSGTMAALAAAANKVEAARALLEGQGFGLPEIEALYRRLRPLDLDARKSLPGINSRRAEIIVAGAALVALAMREMELGRVEYSDAGLRDGVLVDLAARRAGDAEGLSFLKAERLDSVRTLGERYGYSPAGGEHVARLALQLFRALESIHELPEHYGEILEAAAVLHDIGHYVNSARHHKHTYYLVANSELPGWSDRERLLIANVARYHRGSWPNSDHDGFGRLSEKDRRAVETLAALLRLADACDSGRRREVHSVVATPKSDRVDVTLLASGKAELELWAARQAEDGFRRAFGRKLQAEVETMKPAATAS
jgi:exopolyphosphatase/guanosine-5'-triphosphate,3'-diphosphate pyrophosphatase